MRTVASTTVSYIYRASRVLLQWLRQQRQEGRRLFAHSNSHADYGAAVNHAFGDEWRSLFDLTIFGGAKPAFSRRRFESDPTTWTMVGDPNLFGKGRERRGEHRANTERESVCVKRERERERERERREERRRKKREEEKKKEELRGSRGLLPLLVTNRPRRFLLPLKMQVQQLTH